MPVGLGELLTRIQRNTFDHLFVYIVENANFFCVKIDSDGTKKIVIVEGMLLSTVNAASIVTYTQTQNVIGQRE